jgi:GST-like protein
MSNKAATIDLYSLNTPNGVKVSIALEELGLNYRAHRIDIAAGEQFSEQFLRINPNGKIPALVDHEGPDGESLQLMESGAILLYLAEKTGKLLPANPKLRSEVLQWLFFQVGGIGPMFGQFGHFFKYAADKCQHPYPVERYTNEVKRLLTVIDKRLAGRSYLVAEQYTIADIATFPWIHCLIEFYQAEKVLDLNAFAEVNRWYQSCMSREAVIKGMQVCE